MVRSSAGGRCPGCFRAPIRPPTCLPAGRAPPTASPAVALFVETADSTGGERQPPGLAVVGGARASASGPRCGSRQRGAAAHLEDGSSGACRSSIRHDTPNRSVFSTRKNQGHSPDPLAHPAVVVPVGTRNRHDRRPQPRCRAAESVGNAGPSVPVGAIATMNQRITITFMSRAGDASGGACLPGGRGLGAPACGPGCYGRIPSRVLPDRSIRPKLRGINTPPDFP